jgi:hypothetical protein
MKVEEEEEAKETKKRKKKKKFECYAVSDSVGLCPLCPTKRYFGTGMRCQMQQLGV